MWFQSPIVMPQDIYAHIHDWHSQPLHNSLFIRNMSSNTTPVDPLTTSDYWGDKLTLLPLWASVLDEDDYKVQHRQAMRDYCFFAGKEVESSRYSCVSDRLHSHPGQGVSDVVRQKRLPTLPSTRLRKCTVQLMPRQNLTRKSTDKQWREL